MYYLAKALQAAGLAVMLFGFVVNFPQLMSHTTLVFGLVLFGSGWAIQYFGIRNWRS